MKLKRRAGILAHPTSFPSSFGIGDLGQGAYNFIDFAYACGAKLWQILPLGPTGFGDSPYQSFCTFAGNPLLISPDVLIRDGLLSPEDIQGAPGWDPRSIDYGEVIEYKSTLYKKAFTAFHEQADMKSMRSFKLFCADNAFWLDDFALFTAIKWHFIDERRYTYESEEYLAYRHAVEDELTEDAVNDDFYGAVWNSWPDDIKHREDSAVKEWSEKLRDEIEYYKFLQYCFFTQWGEVKLYATERGIDIVGDIPIYVPLDSSDVWARPELFCLDENGFPTLVAGVPPDYFSATGQLWGNPLYDWPRHRATSYEWWIRRVNYAFKSVDILRIDHFRGFDEYWAVPFGEDTAINGRWLKGPGRELFDRMEEALGELPIIAEDLGIITKSVEELRDSLHFPGMRILQFGMEGGPADYYLPHNCNTTNTVIYTGTHDNDTTRGWYEKTGESTRDYFRRYMNVSGEDPSWDFIRLAMTSPAAYAIVPIQDMFGLGSEARMNMPGEPSGNWLFRYTDEMLNESICERFSYLLGLFNRTAPPAEKEDIIQPAKGEQDKCL